MTLNEKTAYLKGLADGLKLDENDDYALVLKKIIEVLDDVAMTVSDLEEKTYELDAYIEEIDEDLGAVEEEIYGGECDCGCCDDECDCDCDCDCDDDDDEYDEFDDDDFDDDFDDDDDVVFEVNCPCCEETICLPSTIDLAHVICPACGEEFSCIYDECEDDECGCCCHCDDEEDEDED